MKTRICVVVAAVLAFASFANAGVVLSAATGDWVTGSTWAGDSQPLTTDRPWIQGSHTVTIKATNTVVVGTAGLNVGGGGAGYGSGPGYLDITGGSLAMNCTLTLGRIGNGTWTQSGGTVTLAGASNLYLGKDTTSASTGTINMTAGTFTSTATGSFFSGNMTGAVGIVNLSGTAAMSVSMNTLGGAVNGSSGYFNVTDSATLTLGSVNLGNTATAYGEINLGGSGLINVANLYVGRTGSGVVNVNGGKLTANVLDISQAGTGQLKINGGTVQVNNNMGLTLRTNGKIDIASASGVLLTYQDGYAGVFSGDGRIFTSLPGYHIENENVTIEGINFTKTYAIPEPATMAMLGLGALFFRKKRA